MLQVIRLFSLDVAVVFLVLSDEDFRRCSKVLLSCGLFEDESTHANMRNMTMHIFAYHLRPGPILDDLLDGVVTNSLNNLLSNPDVQNDLFQLVATVLSLADKSQVNE